MAYQFKTRVYDESSLDKKEKFSLSVKQSHKLINVLRMKDDDEIIIFNNIYGEWSAKIKIKKSIVNMSTKDYTTTTNIQLTKIQKKDWFHL